MENPWLDRYANLYREYLGEPTFRYGQQPGTGAPEDIHIFTYPQPQDSTFVSASLGVSGYAEQNGGVVEVLFGTSVEENLSARLLLRVLSYLAWKKRPIWHGTRMLDLSGRGFDPGLSILKHKPVLYLMHQYLLPEEAETVFLGTEQGWLFQAVLLTQRESDYLDEAGWEALEDHLVEHEVDLIDLERPSSI